MKNYTYNLLDTIAAITTPPGEGGVAIIRISGKNALEIAGKIFSGDVYLQKSHKMHYGNILDKNGQIVDDALLVVMKGRRSYTGEDTIEVHCHGGMLISRKVLETVIAAGARAAEPGEFTFRAFVNNKIDLAQAEAVQSLIQSKSEHALNNAANHIQGSLSEKIKGFQKSLIDIAAMLEAWIDFPEDDIEFAPIENVLSDLCKIQEEMKKLEETFYCGKMLNDGINLCIVGAPNVGKSSLMNALLNKERAIVTEIPGTTRDTLEDDLQIGGLHFRIVDTAGIRESIDVVEREGIKRSQGAIERADIILLVLDVQNGVEGEFNLPHDKTIAVWNKIDLPYDGLPELLFESVKISARERIGLEGLMERIEKRVLKGGNPQESVFITSTRHKEALTNAIDACQNVIEGIKEKRSPEFLALDMRASLNELGKIIGIDVTEDILSSIFSKFCIGK